MAAGSGRSRWPFGCVPFMIRLMASLRMRKRWTIFIMAGCVMAALIAMLPFPTKREPEHGGRKLREWLKLYVQSSNRFTDGQEAAEAVRHIGTNALPWLLEWIDYEPAGWKRALATNAPAAAQRPGYFRSAYLRLLHRPADDLNWLGRFGFEILGPQARPALPEVQRRMANWGMPWRASRAMEAYTHITLKAAVEHQGGDGCTVSANHCRGSTGVSQAKSRRKSPCFSNCGAVVVSQVQSRS